MSVYIFRNWPLFGGDILGTRADRESAVMPSWEQCNQNREKKESGKGVCSSLFPREPALSLALFVEKLGKRESTTKIAARHVCSSRKVISPLTYPHLPFSAPEKSLIAVKALILPLSKRPSLADDVSLCERPPLMHVNVMFSHSLASANSAKSSSPPPPSFSPLSSLLLHIQVHPKTVEMMGRSYTKKSRRSFFYSASQDHTID